MKKEFLLKDTKFVYSKDELGFEEVLLDFDSAKEIIIVTYNISERESYLINKLRDASPETEICIFTNIPSRWENYYGDMYRETARKKINIYLSKLKPDSIAERIDVFFSFDNHGKIIMTDNIVYVGSANFSDESARNTEVGMISTDKDFINYLRDDIISDLKTTSIKYYEYNYLPLILEVEMSLSNLFLLREELFGQIYSQHDRYEEVYFFKQMNESLSIDTINSISMIQKSLASSLSEVYDATSSFCSNDNILISMNVKYEKCMDLRDEFEEIASEELIVGLASFDLASRANEILDDEYGLEAYDEYLPNYMQKAMNLAGEYLQLQTIECEALMEDMIRIIDEQLVNIKDVIEEFKSLDYMKINKKIDNTK